MKKEIIMSVLVVVFGSFSAYSGLISHYEFQGNLLNGVLGGGDGTAVGGASVICPDPNEVPYPLDWPTICRADLTGSKWIHVGYPGILYSPATTQKITMALWIRTDVAYYRQLLGRRYTWRMYIEDDGKVSFGALDANLQRINLSSNQTVTDGRWNHVAATYDGATGEAILYVNGQVDISITQTDPLVELESDSRYAIGAVADSETAGIHIFDGYMDDVRVYDEILSGAQIYDIYRFTSDTFCLNPSVADLTGDCKVGIEDLSLFVAEWLDSGWGE